MASISIRLEGGAGDCILGTRFAQSVKDKYPGCEITAYVDSEGKTFQKEVLDYLFPTFYKKTIVIPHKKYKEFWIKSQYGLENQKGFIENVPDNILAEMLSYDRFVDLHIDSLSFLDNKEFNFLKYFRRFPKPEINHVTDYGDYILLHLQSTTSLEHRLEKWYIESLISKLKKFIPAYKIYVISTPEINHFYDRIEGIDVLNLDIKGICSYIDNAKLFIGVDSGFRLISHCYDVPTVTLSKQCFQPFVCPPSHIIRWLPYPELTFPLNYDAGFVAKFGAKIMSHPVYRVLPQINDIETDLIKRNWMVDVERSVL